MNTDVLREYYFSAGQNYTTFKNKKEKLAAKPADGLDSQAASPTTLLEEEPQKEVMAIIDTPEAVSENAAAANETAKKAAAENIPTTAPPVEKKAAATKQKGTPAGSAVSAAKKKENSAGALVPSSLGAASAEYMMFLKQQQDLQKCHNKIEDIIINLETHRRREQSDLAVTRKNASELLTQMEGGTGWNLKSKYTVENLVRDSALELHTSQLYSADSQAQYFELIQQAANLQKLKNEFQDVEQYEPHKVSINNGLRRLGRVEKELKDTQVDATQLARIPETLFVQLEHVFTTPTIRSMLAGHEEAMVHLLFKLEQAKEEREAALEDGEMVCFIVFYLFSLTPFSLYMMIDYLHVNMTGLRTLLKFQPKVNTA